MPSDNYFTKLGMSVAKQLAQGQLDAHIAGPMARDAMPINVGPRGRDREGEDPNNGEQESPGDVDQCVMLIQQWLAGIIETAHGMGNGDGQSPITVPVGDRGFRSRNRAAMDAAFAARGARSLDFARRWPMAAKVSLNGFGR